MSGERPAKMGTVTPFQVSRRALLAAPCLALAACGRRKARAFPGYCFVANRDGRSVTAVDLTRFRVRKQIALGAEPAAVLAHPAAARVFVLTPENGTVTEIDGRVLEPTRRVRAGSRAVSMRISPARDALWILYREPASLVELPLDSLQPRRRIPLPGPADEFDLGARGHAAVASMDANSIALVSLARSRVERTLDAGAEPAIVRFRSDGQQLLAASRAGRLLSIFDTAAGKALVRLPLGISPRHFCFNSDAGQLFISGDGMDAVVIVFPYSTEVDQTILAGHAPGVMEVTNRHTQRAPGFLMVANPESDGITVLDIDTRRLVAVVQVGRQPEFILITPDEEYALVLNRKSGDMAVIRILSLATSPNGATRRYKSAPLFTMIPVGEGPVGAAVVAVG
jgi:YVTN family beta-propeller protein